MISLDLLNTLFDIWVQPVLGMLVLLTVVRWHSGLSPASCHWLLLSFSLLILASIPLALFGPHLYWHIVPRDYSELINLPVQIKPVGRLYQWLFALIAMYLMISLYNLIRNLDDFFIARRQVRMAADVDDSSVLGDLRRVATTMGIDKEIRVKQAEWAATPLVCGFRSTTLIVPTNFHRWDGQRRVRVLAHELAHIQRGDWLVKLLVSIVAPFLWIVPGVSRVVERINLYAEFSCDDCVVELFDCRAEYAEDLLHLVGAQSPKSMLSFNDQRFLHARICQILEGGRYRQLLPLTKRLALVMSVAVAIGPIFLLQFTAKIPYVPFVPTTRLNIMFSNSKSHEGGDAVESRGPVAAKYVGISEPGSRLEESLTVVSRPQLVRKTSFAIPAKAKFDIHPQVKIKGYLPQTMQMPSYPKSALNAAREAEIDVVFDIDINGEVSNIRFEGQSGKSPGQAQFRKSVREALTASHFSPAEINGIKTALTDVREEVMFTLLDATKSVNER